LSKLYLRSTLNSLHGFSLLEILVANTLSSLLILMVLIIFFSLYKSYQYSQAEAKLLENGRYAVYLLNRELHLIDEDGFIYQKNVHSIHGYHGNLPKYLQNQVKNDSDVVEVEVEGFPSRAFYIGDSHRCTKLGEKIYALYRKKNYHPREELVSNIVDMKISYGLSCEDSKNVCNYASADQVIKWQKVVSVKILLSLISENKIFASGNKGQRLYRQWQTYIAVR
jgi:Tfp pilus assembly protein PilW